MGNWKQVQARIRKARTGADAPAKLEQLFLKTRDGMVAFELAKVHEEGQREGDALDWYRKAFERFRRDEWRSKAAEAIQRLGGTPPELPEQEKESASEARSDAQPEPAPVPTPRSWAALPDHLYHEGATAPPGDDDQSESDSSDEGAPETEELSAEPGETADAQPHDAVQPVQATGGKRRRRGRRGGRRHRKNGERAGHQPGTTQGHSGHSGHSGQSSHSGHPSHSSHTHSHSSPRSEGHSEVQSEGDSAASRPLTPPPSRQSDEAPAGWIGARAEEMRTRAGDPGLASRVARLEMQIRRLLACPPHKVSEGDLAPAGPGVLLLSDSDLTTHYYICACDTLRIEISRLTRSDRGGRNRGREQSPPLRSRLAEHLEINDSQVSKYLESHCVVRWLQLDEGAPRVAHFATAVLEPIVKS